MIPLKRRKVVPSGAGNTGNTGSEESSPNKFPQVILFLLERKMGASRRAFLSQLGRKKGLQVEEMFSERVTHVICENISGDEVVAWLESGVGGRGRSSAHLLDVSWFTESMRAGRPVEVLDRHRLQQQMREAEVVGFSAPSYACQRRTTLDNHNAILTDALSLLAENAELSGEDGRGVAFRRATAVLKGLPEPVTAVTQLVGLPCLGGHSLRVVKEVLESGASSEVEATKQSERFKALKVLTAIFGVGVKTAERWMREGIHDLQQLRDSGRTLDRSQRAGLQHYDDLNQPVTRPEADAVAAIVEEALAAVLPGATTTLIGGFRRGKLTGHDVDFLLTHPEEGREVGLMTKVVSWLETQGFLLYQKTTRNSYLEAEDGPARPSSNMDRFDRCLSIFKLPVEVKGEGLNPWRAVRVDLVVSPISQFAFALLGWTGSKLFERELRRWAGHEKAMSLSSHALYDKTQSRYLRASSEEEIFAYLGLEYIPPSERNA
ncbi:DNA-directed DNA/RNA polymerase mu isoform X2 [Pseudoliparis swirei]|uniref:DNA-directed DNA/RNA polymerase mu isoform X2 n=1 Tax=Pseudoliparis swirei TaxID=2059687 RepID=UPI0024BDB755|nr:DNA-directed DNA/RNA polymerase mu isoform X2 [Pseudoliparis swirei]